jgi:hypothetical protein
MDELTAFERQLEREVHRALGPVRPVDVAMVVRTARTSPHPAAGADRTRGWLRFGRPSAPVQDEYRPGPTVRVRTQTMFSPAKATVAAAIIFAIGGVLLAVEPFGRTGTDTPAAAPVELAEPVAFTGSISPSGDEAEETCQVVEGISQCRGRVIRFFVVEMSDPRLDGHITASQGRDTHPDGRWFVSWTYRIENDDGAWQGSTDTVWYAGDFGAHSVVLAGDGAYEGLYAWADMTDWADVKGVIFAAPPPETPTAPLGDSGT